MRSSKVMSDAQTVWQLSVALACTVGAAWMKFCGGVSDDSKANDVRDGVAGHDLLRGVRDRGLARGADSMMKDADEHRGQIIDFAASRDRILMRRWAVANGFDRVRG